MTPIIFAWLTTFFYAFSGISGKLTSKYHLDNPFIFNIFWMFYTFLFILPVTFYSGFSWPGDWTSILALSLTNAASNVFYVLALYRLDISVLAPVYSLRTPLVVILGVILFKEILTASQVTLIGLIFLAGIFVGIDEKTGVRAFIRRDMGLIAITMLVSALYNISIKYASLGNDFREIVFWSNFLGLVFTLPTLPLFLADLKKLKPVKTLGIALSTLLGTIGLLVSYKALGDNVSISIVIISLPTSMLLAVALSVFRPKLLEKHPLKIYAIRLTAAAIMTVSAIFLSL